MRGGSAGRGRAGEGVMVGLVVATIALGAVLPSHGGWVIVLIVIALAIIVTNATGNVYDTPASARPSSTGRGMKRSGR